MKKLLTILALATLLTSASALADTENHPTRPYKAVCSVVTGDGVWAVYYNNYREIACKQARHQVTSRTRTPITNEIVSYYNPYSYIRLKVRCTEARKHFEGYGEDALRQGYHWTRRFNLHGCTFRVN